MSIVLVLALVTAWIDGALCYAWWCEAAGKAMRKENAELKAEAARQREAVEELKSGLPGYDLLMDARKAGTRIRKNTV